MNNGKVRIYELSKELNLDNKELLAICEVLSIAVKSHSSTITEIEAELIRKEAEKLTASNVMSRKDSSNGQKAPSPQVGPHGRAGLPQKQEILEIRKPKLLKNPSINGVIASSATNNEVASSEATPPSPPRPFATNTVSSMKPTAPIRPVHRDQSESQEALPLTDVDDQTPIENQPAGETQTDPVPVQEVLPSKPARPEKPEKPQKPQLSSPPNRESEEQSPKVEKPLLKRDQQPKAKTTTKPANVDSPQKGTRPAQMPVKPEQKEQRVNRPGVVDGARPSRPVRPSANSPVAAPPIATPPRPMAAAVGKSKVSEEGDEEDVVEVTDETIELKRPTAPRLAKGGKKWQEEEIIDEVKEKAKTAIKGKRLKPIVDDFEDEDLTDDDDIDSPTTIQVSNAIVRPPKPKSGKAAQPAQAPQIARPKQKSAAVRGSDRNERRETESAKPDRPEKIVVTGTMTVQELAEALGVADTEIVKILFVKGMAVSITHNLDIQTIKLIATELEVEVETAEPEAEARKVTEMIDAEDMDSLQRRPPVVTIMGHVDHGKTTLLDSIRKTKVAAGEAGGITQHIGAYHVDVQHDGKTQQVVFLDTPGHEAFTAMRARGARVTDIAILVVAADDGVRPQTVEAISHAQAAEVPLIVAINKIDKEGAQPERVKQELTQYGLTPEEWGGDTIMVPVSAIKGENLDTLLEMILLVAEVGELSANPDRPAKGTVIEAHLDKAKGPVATLLIQNGTLRVGDILVAGPVLGKVRAMMDDRGKRVDVGSPSFAVEVLGLSDVPAAGDEFDVFLDDKTARTLAGSRLEKQRQSRLMQGRVTLTSISAQAQEGDLKELNLILKADVQGSLEAIVGALRQIPQNEVQIRLLLSAAGEITETDIDLAAASGAVIIGFNTTYASGARLAADEAGVDVREYNIIYKLLEDIQGALEGLLEPELVEEPLGIAEVRAVFTIGRGAVAGCYVQSGKLLRNCKVRARRGSKVIYEGNLDSLKRMREDAREVNAGYECGLGVDKFNEWAEGDIIEAFQMVTKRRTLSLVR